jgi:hypothetical protein
MRATKSIRIRVTMPNSQMHTSGFWMPCAV